ncbi:MAG TPA: hypothetical protein VIV40_02020 [Kofleriaceae bacterium]
MLQAICLEALSNVVGGAGPAQKWNDIRTAAQPHCPQTVASHPTAPSNRAQAQAIGDACLAEMGSFKASLGGRAKIQAGIDSAFPK